MKYILSEEEYKELTDVRVNEVKLFKKELSKLRDYKQEFIENCKEYAEHHKLNCNGKPSWHYDCDDCIIKTLAPVEYSADYNRSRRCPLGGIIN